MRIVLIGNYLPDRQQSMIRFTEMLHAGFQGSPHTVEVWLPPVYFGRLVRQTQQGLGKWLGYIDKWILFPIILRSRLRKQINKTDVTYHVCDHSNAPYLSSLPPACTLITCHDVLAIRSAFGYADTWCETSRTGKIFQNWIFKNLSKADKVACVSAFTLKDLQEILPVPLKRGQQLRVIPNALNAGFYPMEATVAWKILEGTGLEAGIPFILHVGGGHPRKNRGMLVEMTRLAGAGFSGQICFAGELPDTSLLKEIMASGLAARVIKLTAVPHELLVALYSTCYAFIFPSLSEGFGWPVIEAQACGAPLITSNKEPMLEVSGSKGLNADPNSPEAFTEKLLKLSDPQLRQKVIEEGLENAKRYGLPLMLDSYVEFYLTTSSSSQ